MDDKPVKKAPKPFGIEYLEEVVIPPDFGSSIQAACCTTSNSSMKTDTDDFDGSYCTDVDMCV